MFGSFSLPVPSPSPRLLYLTSLFPMLHRLHPTPSCHYSLLTPIPTQEVHCLGELSPIPAHYPFLTDLRSYHNNLTRYCTSNPAGPEVFGPGGYCTHGGMVMYPNSRFRWVLATIGPGRCTDSCRCIRHIILEETREWNWIQGSRSGE